MIDEYLDGLEGDARRLAHTEWGLTLPAETAGGWPCEIGVRVEDELLRVKAFAVEAQDGLDPWLFLHWNRQTRLVRLGCTRAGDIWVLGDIPVQAVTADQVDRLLGLTVEGVLAVRAWLTAR